MKALRGRRGHAALMLAWATLIAGGFLGGGVLIVAHVSSNSAAVEQSVCAIIRYAETQAGIIERGDPSARPPRAPNPRAARNLRQLAREMRDTGVRCPAP